MHQQKYEIKELKGEGRKYTCPLIRSSRTQFDANCLLPMSLLQSFLFTENSIKKSRTQSMVTVWGKGWGRRERKMAKGEGMKWVMFTV